MFAFDTMAPINGLFALFILLCLCACVAGMIETQQDRTESEMPAAFRDMSGPSTVSASVNGHASDGARRGQLNGDGKGRGK